MGGLARERKTRNMLPWESVLPCVNTVDGLRILVYDMSSQVHLTGMRP